jgi:mono/diheme cytochrome c family protein
MKTGASLVKRLLRIGCLLVICEAASGQDAGKTSASKDEVPNSAPIAVDLGRAKSSFDSICAVCHGAKGEGGIGLPLKNIADRLTVEQTIDKIKNPNPAMPKLYPDVLSEQDVLSLAAFIRTFR